MLARRACELRTEQKLLRSKAVFEATIYSKERTSTEDLYDAAVIRRSAVVGHVTRNMSAGCALFLRQNHLQQVLFTRVQSCHEKSGRVVRTRVWVVPWIL